MGNKTSSTAKKPSRRKKVSRNWPERNACSAEPGSRATVSEREVWDMATAWYQQLEGTVRLATSLPQEDERWRAMGHVMNDDYAIVRHYEWIDFDFSRVEANKLDDTVRAARASMIVWFALSCCPGFGGDENPAFWKRVFSVLMRSIDVVGTRTTSVVYHGAVSDGVLFFNQRNAPFPQVRFVWRDDLPLQLIWEREAKRWAHDRILNRKLRRLRPFVRQLLWQRGIPVAIRTKYASTELTNFLKSLNLSRSSAYPTPTLHFDRIFCPRVSDGLLVGMAAASRTNAHIIVATQDIGRGLSGIEATMNGQPVQTWRDVVDVVTVDELNVQCSTSMAADESLAVGCSMLSVRANMTSMNVCTTVPLSETSAAWIGYAIFHPDMPSSKSSFENLKLRLRSDDDAAIRALQRMALGNNLALSSTPSTTYDQVKVPAGTIVRSDRQQGKVLYTFISTSWIPLVAQPQHEGDPWVRVVLPEYGLEWMRSDYIVATQSHPPASSRIRRLKISIDQERHVNDSRTKAPMLNLLSIIGDRLEYFRLCLRIAWDFPQSHSLDASTVQSIMHACPNLKSLRIQHEGSYWASSAYDITSDSSRLEELELTIGDGFMPMDAPQLNHLKTLVIVARGSYEFASYADDIRSILLRYPQLVRFAWQRGVAGPEWRYQSGLQYDESRERTRRLLGLSASEESMASVPLRLDARLAFVSVVQHRLTQSKAMSRLPPEAMERIFSFSSSHVPRQFFIHDLFPRLHRAL